MVLAHNFTRSGKFGFSVTIKVWTTNQNTDLTEFVTSFYECLLFDKSLSSKSRMW